MRLIKLRNSRSWKPGGIRPSVICTLGFIFAFLLRHLLSSFLDDGLSMLFFTINCIVMGYLFGYVYSMALLVASLPTSLFFFRKPFYVIDSLTHEDIMRMVIYTVIIMLSSIIIEWLQRERYAAVLQQRVSETRYKLLIESDQARRAEYAQHFATVDTGADRKEETFETARPNA